MAEQRSAVVIGVGAQAGLGAALCRRFARGGLHVFVAGRTAEKLERVAEDIRAAGGAATALVADATDEGQVAALLDAAEAVAPVDLAAFNPGGGFRLPLLELTPEMFEDAWRVNAFGGFLFGREAVRRMRPRKRGTILFTGATASVRSRPPFTAFAAGKHALRALTHAMAREFAADGLHVATVIIDGAINGERLRSRAPEYVEARRDGGLLELDAIADSYWMLHGQDRSAWTLELDLRPYKEPF